MSSESVAEICALLAARPEALSAVASGRSYVPLLALLEHPLPEVERQLQSCLVAAGVAAEHCAAISLEALVAFALGSWGSHWPALAVSWLENGMPVTSEIAGALESMSSNKGLPQAVRHRAFALAKRASRPRSGQARE
jgi:hypothetical protein